MAQLDALKILEKARIQCIFRAEQGAWKFGYGEDILERIMAYLQGYNLDPLDSTVGRWIGGDLS